ncbi:MAG: DUF2235 domain-containing protein [Candidatus Korobacteraceae bacterium]
MPKNIVICCDGTANEFAEDNTNVVKLFYVLNHDQAKQVTFYHPGLGTMEPAGSLTTFSRQVTKLLGKALGYGLSNDIRDAYEFLMEKYEEGDRLFLFGFSRGAYTVRAVCSLLHMYGLIRKGNEPLVPYAVRMMIGIDRAEKGDARQRAATSRYFELARGFRETMSRSDCKPWFVGVWDTVSSVGWIENPLRLPFVSDNPDIEIARHAVSIDEHRAFFRNNLWRPGNESTGPHGPRDLKQVWFPGVHCDVGGGYPEAESGLAKVALEWMVEEAEANGLLADRARKDEVLGKTSGSNYAPPDPNGLAHESLKGAWNLAEFAIKRHFDWMKGKWGYRMNLWRRRTIPPNSLVHESAFQRSGSYSSRLPGDAIRVKTAVAPLERS